MLRNRKIKKRTRERKNAHTQKTNYIFATIPPPNRDQKGNCLTYVNMKLRNKYDKLSFECQYAKTNRNS